MTTWHHQERLQAVQKVVRETGSVRVVDLGCGAGDLFVQFASDPSLTELVGIDICRTSLDRLRHRLAASDPVVPLIDLREGSMTDPIPDVAGFDCAVLVETIEHLAPAHLSKLERSLFRMMRPKTVVITTPNAEFNALLGVPPHRMRHPEHRFEWTRAEFQRWSARVAMAAGYHVIFHDIAGHHPDLGGASQMAVFTLNRPKALTDVA